MGGTRIKSLLAWSMIWVVNIWHSLRCIWFRLGGPGNANTVHYQSTFLSLRESISTPDRTPAGPLRVILIFPKQKRETCQHLPYSSGITSRVHKILVSQLHVECYCRLCLSKLVLDARYARTDVQCDGHVRSAGKITRRPVTPPQLHPRPRLSSRT